MSHVKPAPCCSIAPPDILARLAAEGTPEQRAAAIRALGPSSAFRAERALIGRLGRELNLGAAQLGGLALATGRKLTAYDNQHQGRYLLPGVKVRGTDDPPAADESANQAFDGSGTTYDFYRTVLGRNSVDDAGMELVSSVHYGVGYDNAFWNGVQMVYGDGSGTIFRTGALTKAIDVIGHELTHGVTQYTAGLVYSKQPGALNESFSDVFGSLVKQYSLNQTADEADWLIGEGTLVPELGGALRSMSNPGTAYPGDNQPAHMKDYKDLPDDNDPKNDSGGVHINSGIPNRAFYLAATALGGHAWEVAGKIWYKALTQHLKPDTQFAEAAQMTVDVAQDVSAKARKAVKAAWKEVGVL